METKSVLDNDVHTSERSWKCSAHKMRGTPRKQKLTHTLTSVLKTNAICLSKAGFTSFCQKNVPSFPPQGGRVSLHSGISCFFVHETHVPASTCLVQEKKKSPEKRSTQLLEYFGCLLCMCMQVWPRQKGEFHVCSTAKKIKAQQWYAFSIEIQYCRYALVHGVSGIYSHCAETIKRRLFWDYPQDDRNKRKKKKSNRGF